ncbi:telomere length regulation protein TEL2 homolog isoform X1 [Neodiprion fabricii]|uniref:telomere length regulation protein TEL2 homolog isoform X1 n=1 Tax=Neodiprion fabricii TaxID=2872261 RepID=UPI001ED96696|nr:telomere length regulation protein TEL2 homolog isoform X1 [Neodiprion fabricii]
MMNMWKMRELMDKATNVVMNYTDTEAKVREATNDDAWGPTGAMMQELAQATFTYEQFPEVMSMLWKRMLQENKRNWRRTYKSLLLLNYLVRNGSERVVTSSREHIYDLRSLENYTYIDEFGKDQGINIRHKVRELIDFIQDDDKLRDERKKAKKNKDKYIGMSSEAMGMRFGAGDRWNDSPKWNKPAIDGYNDWDRESKGKGFEDGNNSDDGEREDSDNDTPSSPRRSGREYRDTTETIDRIAKSSQPSTPSGNQSPAKTPRVFKKVDLGAAAHFGKDQSNNSTPVKQSNLMSSPVKEQKNKNDILNDIFDSQSDVVSPNNEDDDFNPRGNNHTAGQPQSANTDFGDFASAFGGSATKLSNDEGTDEFADFTSAFDAGVNISSSNNQQPQISLLGATIPNIGNPMTGNSSSPLSSSQNITSPAFGTSMIQNSAIGNNLYNSLPPQGLVNQTQSLVNSNNNPASSNTDLLADLGGFSSLPTIPPMGTNMNNANLFGSANSTPINPLDFNSASRPEGINLKHAANRLLETLQRIEEIKSDKELDEIKHKINEYTDFFPGLYTPQKYIGIDTHGIDVDVISYGRILENVIEKFDHNWPLVKNKLDKSVKNLFVVEGCTSLLLNESLSALSEALKETENKEKARIISVILESLIKSDALYSAIVNVSKIHDKTELEKLEIDEGWKNIVQILISLPNRVANKLNGKLPDVFSSETYANIVYFHFLRSVKFINEGFSKFDIKPDFEYLSILLSKSALILNRASLTELTRIFAEWCIENCNDARCFVEKVLHGLNSQSIEPIAVAFLMQSVSASGICNVFGNLISNSNWKYILTNKIPLLSYYDDEYLPKNLISYLSHCNESDRSLIKLLTQLLKSWSNRSILNHITFEQHIFITKLMILSLKELHDRLTPADRNTILSLMFSGTQAHLEMVQPKLRAIGMITAEIFTEILNKSMSGAELKFEYDEMGEDVVEMTKELRQIKIHYNPRKQARDDAELVVENLEFYEIGDKMLYQLGVKCKILRDLTVKNINENTSPRPVEEPQDTGHGNSAKDDIRPNLIPEDEEDLDSDDDLTPYDMSNDTKISQSKRPAYLRDLRDNLTDPQTNSDPDVFSGNMEICEELILSQLPNDDVSFGIELLEILVTLGEKSYVEDFESLKFNSCTAIVTVFPKESAEYLCKQFHAEVGTYSVMQRLLFLEVLQDAAKKLANCKLEDDESASLTPKTRSEMEKKKATPISLMVETDKTKKYETLFADDFEISDINEANRVDWEDIVNKRIQSNTRRLTHGTKLPKTAVNKFANVASSFFYPLLYGFGRKGALMCGTPKVYEDQDCILLVNFLKTLSVLMVSANNCYLAPKMGKEILDLSWTLRYHYEGKVRMAVIQNIASVVISTPTHFLTTELFEQIFDARNWLADISQNTFRGDPNASCRSLGINVLSLIDSVIGSSLNKL